MNSPARPLRIGDLAQETGKTVRALRYYEELGILVPQDHTEGGFRLYRPADAERVRLIDRLQDLGFSLERIRALIQAWSRGGTGEDVARQLRRQLEESLRDTQERVSRLKRVEGELLEALRFLEACGSCHERPGRERCTECEKGDHRARLPQLMDGLVR